MPVIIEIRLRRLIARFLYIVIRLLNALPIHFRSFSVSKGLSNIQKAIKINIFDNEDFLIYVGNKKNGIEYNAKSIKTLIIGSSHADYGFYSNIVENSYNLGLTSGDLYTSYQLYEKYKDKLVSLENIVLFYSVFSSGFSLIKTNERYRAVAYEYFFNIPYQVSDLIKRRFEKYIIRKCKVVNQSSDFHTFSGYRKKSDYGIFLTAQERVKSHLRENSRNPDQMNWLSALIRAVNENNKKLFIVLPPLRADYKLLLPQSSQVFHKLNRMITNYDNVVLINYFDSELFKPEDFGDTDHLNEQGAIILTKDISKYF